MAQERKKKNKGRSRAGKVSAIKVVVLCLMILLQVFFWLCAYAIAKGFLPYWKTGALLLSGVVVLYIVNKQDNPAYKLAWVILVLVAPLVGGILYASLAGNRTRKKFVEKALQNHLDTFQYMPDDGEILREIHQLSQSSNVQSTYISKTAGYPVYKKTQVQYFPLGEDNFAALQEELSKAKHFIFMEYFIIKQGYMWDRILEILKEKAKAGVDVRLIYDDFGCSLGVPARFSREMSEYGIRAVPFNPMVPVINLRQNNRDHRKITVIDGCVGFTGGINLADEYINRESRFGHWKDTGIMLRGEAVWNLTLMFLQTWLMVTGKQDDYRKYKPECYMEQFPETDGYIQPYGDTPVDDEIVGENIYLNIINKAKHYVYIMTPYLILDNEMVTALCLAARSGIDVRIITPGIPDKKMVYLVTQSYYHQLVSSGVRIYQYTPGFVHAKTVVADDRVATVGTVNFDYRSFYLHFECGVWMFRSDVIYEIRDDFNKTLCACDEVTLEELKKTGAVKRFWQGLLRLAAPLM